VDITKEVGYKNYSKIDVGFVTENEFKKLSKVKKMGERQLLDFRIKCLWRLKIVSQLYLFIVLLHC
jgi:hypothetical protein